LLKNNHEVTAYVKNPTLEGIPKAGRNISREDLADLLVNAIENNENINESVGLAY